MRHPKGIAVYPRTHKVYVASRDNDSLYVLDGSTLTVNPDTNRVYVTLHGINGVAVISGATDTAITTPSRP
ncbi:MAG: hypothetical protein H8E47_01090, partial [Anaerolineales bacterium]|nr:hypothetical protein [Anaerolineales bacterium]